MLLVNVQPVDSNESIVKNRLGRLESGKGLLIAREANQRSIVEVVVFTLDLHDLTEAHEVSANYLRAIHFRGDFAQNESRVRVGLIYLLGWLLVIRFVDLLLLVQGCVFELF